MPSCAYEMRPRRPAAALRGPGERHQADDRLQHAVAQLHAVEQRRGAGAEQRAVERVHAEVVPRGGALGQQVGGAVGPAAAEAVADEGEQPPQAVVQIEAVERFAGGQAHQLQVAQALQAVALAVGLGVERRVAELRARLDVEQEQQAVHPAQAFEAQPAGERVVGAVVQLVLEHLAQVVDRLVAEQLDRLAQGVLQVLGDGEGVLVAVVVEPVEQGGAGAVGGQQAAAVEQDGGGLHGRVLAPAEELVDVEAQQPVVRPLAAARAAARG